MGRRQITTRFVFEERNAGVINQVTQGVAGFAKFAFSPAGAVAGVAALGAGVVKLTGDYLENADALQKMSLRTGLGTEELGALKFAFEQADLTGDDLQRTIAKLNDQGLTLDQVADQIAGIDDISERTGLAIDLLGERLGPKLLTVLDQGSAGLDRYRQEHERLGLAIDQESAEAAAKFNDNIDTIERVVGGAGQRVGMGIANWAGPIVAGFGKAVGILPTELDNKLTDIETALDTGSVDAGVKAALVGEAIKAGIITPVEAAKIKSINDLRELYNELVAFVENTKNLGYLPPNEETSEEQKRQRALLFSTGSLPDSTPLELAREEAARRRRQGDARAIVNDQVTSAAASLRLLDAQRSAIRGDALAAGRSGDPYPNYGGISSYDQILAPDGSPLGLPVFAQGGSGAQHEIAASQLESALLLKEGAILFNEAVRLNDPIAARDALGQDGGEFGGGFGGGGGMLDGKGLIEASKDDPLRVSLAAFGGLNEDAAAAEQKNLRPLQIEGTELLNEGALRQFVLDVIENYVE